MITFLPIVCLSTFILNKRFRTEISYNLYERLAIYNIKNDNKFKKVVWIHCASLGEVKAVATLINKLKNKFFIILTTCTKSGKEYAKQSLKLKCILLSPLDIYPIMLKAFKLIRPNVIILTETELWPNMLYIASRKHIKIILVNGRISDKSFKYYKVFSFFWRRLLYFITIIIVKSNSEANKFLDLIYNDPKIDLNGSNIFVTNNIKYDNIDININVSRSSFCCLQHDFIFVAGSTCGEEELFIIKLFNEINTMSNSIKFFIAPRHINRVSSITKLSKKNNIMYSLFSHKKFDNNFIIVDVFGELQYIYSIADVCFIGGSMVKRGGHNPIEAAIYGKPILFGHYMNNFKEEAELLVKANGAIIIDNVSDLIITTSKLMRSNKLRQYIGNNALLAVRSKRGSINFILNKIITNLT
jgi:3-deoxy-D-manno-octulosonic-acid transferase